MTPDRDPTIRALLEQRLDALSDDLLQNTIMLRDGQERIEKRAASIEKQAKITNGRVSNLELKQARNEGRAEEHREEHRKTVSWIQPIVTGTVTAIVVLIISLILTGTL